jgi:hypothetical protein
LEVVEVRRRRERVACLVLDFLGGFVFGLGIVLAIYIKEDFVGFSPPLGFPMIK